MTPPASSKPRYRKPPILEAVCEIQFDGHLYSESEIEVLGNHWRAEYPQQNSVVERSLGVRVDMQGASVVEGNQGHKLICRSEDQLRLVQLSGRLLAVNQLRPYMGWEEGFRDTILARWHEVKEMLRVGKVARIGLRYINRIEILQNPLKWEDWFHFSLPLPASMQQAEGKFHMVFQQPLDGGLNCTVNIAKDQAAPQGATWVILDFNVILEASIPADDLPHHLERIHGPHSLAFEAYVRDSLRQQFEPLPAS